MAWSRHRATAVALAAGVTLAAGVAPAAAGDVTVLRARSAAERQCADGQRGCQSTRAGRGDTRRPPGNGPERTPALDGGRHRATAADPPPVAPLTSHVEHPQGNPDP